MPMRGSIESKEVLEMSEADKAKSQVAASDEFGGLGGLILQRLDRMKSRMERLEDRVDAKIDALEVKLGSRIDALDAKVGTLERWAFSTIIAVLVGAGAVIVTMVAHP